MLRPSDLTRALILLSVILVGCPQPPAQPGPAARSTTPVSLRLLVVDDPDLGKAIAREWQASTEETLEVKEIASGDLTAASRLPGDIVLFPSGLIGQLVEKGLIVPLDDAVLADPGFDRRDIFDQIRLREMTWGNRTVAVSLGSPQLLLAYRADIFERLGLTPPGDWTEYQAAVEKLADRAAFEDLAPAAGEPWRATVEPLADGWAGQLLLARAAAYAMHRDQLSPLLDFDSAEPLIGLPPYTRALKELVAAAQTGGFSDLRFTPDEALNEVRSGRAAMALGWPAPDPGHSPESQQSETRAIRFEILPGSKQSYNFSLERWEARSSDDASRLPALAFSGRLAAVSSNATSRKRAEGFLLWLAGSQMSGQISPHSRATTLFRQSHIADAQKWTGGVSPTESQQYAETVRAALSLPQAFPGIRLPGRPDYLAALDKAVQRAVSGEAAPAEALAEAAGRWKEITAEVGVEKQKLANRRSLGQADLP